MESLKDPPTELRYQNKYYLIYLVLMLLNLYGLSLRAQSPLKLRSTLSAGSSNEKTSSATKSFPIQQSIGQSGVIGTYTAKGYILRQGFIQPVYKKGTIEAETLAVKVAPNPFSDAILIRTDVELTEKINVAIFDLLGKPVYTKQHYASPELSIDLSSLSRGLYFLKLTSAKKAFTTKLIKN